jgi:hypothetical protein
MKHLSEDDLTALYYGERATDGSARLHLAACRRCAADYDALKQTLDGILPATIPQRGGEYGEQVWRMLAPRLMPYELPAQRGGRRWMQWRPAAAAIAGVMLAVLAFAGGRLWERHTKDTTRVTAAAGPQAVQRVVLVVVTDHLDRTERLLVALEHAVPGDSSENSELQSQARDLLASNRLARASASEAGDADLAGALERVGRLLAEVGNEPRLSAADLDLVRREMNSEGILFEVRVLLSKTPDGKAVANNAKGASI